MKIKFWGVRGSIPTPSHPTDVNWKLEQVLSLAEGADLNNEASIRRFISHLPPLLAGTVGGNTPCVEVKHDGATIILDAGSGLRELGHELNRDAVFSESELYLAIEAGHKISQYGRRERSAAGLNLTFLLSHAHWDHIQGFPFFPPAFSPDNTIAIFGASGPELAEAFQCQQRAPSLFPIALGDMGADISFNTFPPEGLEVGGITVKAMAMPHPGGSLAYRLTAGGGSLVYATDYEFASIDSDEAGEFVNFIKNADVLISDTQYTYLEGAAREGWGHSTSFEAMDLAMRAGVRAFYMFHHDPAHNDAKLVASLEKTRAYHNTMSGRASMTIELAIEGQEVEV